MPLGLARMMPAPFFDDGCRMWHGGGIGETVTATGAAAWGGAVMATTGAVAWLRR